MSALLDTSVIIRYLTDDPRGSAAAAARVIDAVEDLYISDVVLAECAFVLSSNYKVPRAEVVSHLIELVQKENIDIPFLGRILATQALQLCEPSNRVSFVDALTWASALAFDVKAVYSLDRRFPSDEIELRHLPTG